MRGPSKIIAWLTSLLYAMYNHAPDFQPNLDRNGKNLRPSRHRAKLVSKLGD